MSIALVSLYSGQLWVVFSSLLLKPPLLSSVCWKGAHCFIFMFLNIYEWGVACFEILIGHLCFFFMSPIFISFIYFYFGLLLPNYWSSNYNSLSNNKVRFLKMCVYIYTYIYIFIYLYIYIYIFFFGPSCTVCEMLVLQPGIIPMPPALAAWSLNHWTTREAPKFFAYICWKYIFF